MIDRVPASKPYSPPQQPDLSLCGVGKFFFESIVSPQYTGGGLLGLSVVLLGVRVGFCAYVLNDFLERGTLTLPDGTRYVGDYRKDRFTGKGTLRWANGEKYEGDFVNGKRTGKGTLTLANGGKYVGDFVDNKITGKGTLTLANGEKYEGDFVNGKRTGKGTVIWADGNKYEGDFVNGMRKGKGKITFLNGNSVRGEFYGDRFLDLDKSEQPLPDFLIPQNNLPFLVLETTPDGDDKNAFNKSGLDRKMLIERMQKITNSVLEVFVGSKTELQKRIPNIDIIGLLWVRAHGNPRSMLFGKDDIEFEDLKPLLNKLDTQSVVVLDSCLTGNPNGYFDGVSMEGCIAEKIFNYLCSIGKNPTVIAPSQEVGFFSFKQVGKNRVGIEMYNYTSGRVSRVLQLPAKK